MIKDHLFAVEQAAEFIQCNCGERCEGTCTHSELLRVQSYLKERVTLEALEEKFITEHPDYPKSDWSNEAFSYETRLGYWEWVMHKLDSSTFCIDTKHDLMRRRSGPNASTL